MPELNENVKNKLQQQIQEEFYSSYLYLSMSFEFDQQGLSGFAHWMRKQAQEEWAHGMRICNYLISIGYSPVLKPLESPPRQHSTPLIAFDAALSHERHISGCIDTLMTIARENKDYRTENLLIWFIEEQIEEEEQTSEILEQLKMIGDSTVGILRLDSVLGRRE